MPLIYRNVTGPVHDAEGNPMSSGVVRIKLRAPLIDDLTFISTEVLEATITDGDFTIALAAPGNYDFTVVTVTNDTLWSFHAPLLDDVDTDISLSELYLYSLTEETADIIPNITQFAGLFDTPSSYTGEMGQYVAVKTEEDGLEFIDPGTLLPFNLRLDAILDGSNLKTVGDVEGASTPLQLAEDAVKVDAAPLIVDQITFDKAVGIDVAEGEMAWNDVDGTMNIGMKGGVVVLQTGQEMLVPALNNTGSNIANGKPVYIDGTSGDFPTIALAKADDKSTALFFGVTTEQILKDTIGFVNIGGKVRGVDTSAVAAGKTAFLSDSVAGEIQPTPPAAPHYKARVGMCIVSDVSDGIMLVQPAVVNRLQSLSDVTISDPIDQEILVYNEPVGIFENKIPSMTQRLTLTNYVDEATRGKEIAQFGGMEVILSGGSFSTGTPETATNGCGKLVFVINAGSDLVGDMTITGDTVDRNTGVITLGDTEVVTLDGATTDGSDTDAQGNIRHELSSAYITDKWFQGAVSISTTEVDVSDFDLYNVAFHQFGDTPLSIELNMFDITGLPTNTAAWLFAYIYTLEQMNGTCEIARCGSIEILAADIDAADVHYRRKIGEIGKTLNPATDGIWVDIYAGPFNQTYWEDISTIVIYSATAPLTLS